MSSPALDSESNSASLILGHQRHVFEKLLAIGRACFSIHRTTLPIRPRANSLVVGPTGSGKTFLAQTAARELGVPLLSLAVSNWILLGCSERGSETTWRTIYNFLYENCKSSSGVVIFIDELDKLTGESSWDAHLRVECFGLLDLTLPTGLKDDEGNLVHGHRRAVAESMLANRTLIIGAGTFQNWWEIHDRQQIGFGEADSEFSGPTPDELARMLPREIVNRFRSPLVLPLLHRREYTDMLATTAAQIPNYLRDTFLQIGQKKIPEAVIMQQGCRFLEDVMMETILIERAQLREMPPSVQSDQHPGGAGNLAEGIGDAAVLD